MKQLTLSDFKRLPHARWIWNAIIPVKKGVRLSVSFSEPGGLWHVGNLEDFEVAIQVNSGHENGWSLVTIDGRNTFDHCDHAKIEHLATVAKLCKIGPRIEVFDVRQGSPTPQWWHRFDTVKGDDLNNKLDYCRRLWTEGETFRTLTK